ncbi:MAG: CDP-archaeol synthase [Clostridiales bacterium]|nr:CDP-archaeol synthase [Clostridiales bacterium]
MKMRILTGLVGGALAFVVLLLLPPVFLNIAMSIICGMAMYEVLIVSRFVGHRGLTAAAVAFAMLTPFFLLPGNLLPAMGAMLAYVMALTFLQIRYHKTLSMERIGFVFFVSVVFPLSFSCLAYLRTYSLRGCEADGLFYVFLALVIPWMCDMGAYFVGTFLGRHKLCPDISPKKTVEGAIGGIVVSVLSALLAAFLYQILYLGDTASVSYWQIGLLALIGTPLSMMGDLLASIIKRQCQVKDFGHIMPGHGGLMDRFDSLLLTAPLLFIAVHYLPLIY